MQNECHCHKTKMRTEKEYKSLINRNKRKLEKLLNSARTIAQRKTERRQAPLRRPINSSCSCSPRKKPRRFSRGAPRSLPLPGRFLRAARFRSRGALCAARGFFRRPPARRSYSSDPPFTMRLRRAAHAQAPPGRIRRSRARALIVGWRMWPRPPAGCGKR